MDFANGQENCIEWIDDLRVHASRLRIPQIKPKERDAIDIEVIRKFTSRNFIYQVFEKLVVFTVILTPIYAMILRISY